MAGLLLSLYSNVGGDITRGFSRSYRMLNTDTRKMLYNAIIASRLNYCDSIWDSCKMNNKNKIQTIQNRCARRILNCLPGTSAAPLLRELGWIDLDQKRKLHKCVFLHRLMKGSGPAPLISMLEPLLRDSSAGTRTVCNGGLFIPRYRTDYVGRSFFIETAKLWNKIPLEIKLIDNSKTFKERLHVLFLNGMSA